MREGGGWRYWLNLAAQDFPLLPQAGVRARLEAAFPASLLQVLPEVKE